MRQPISKPSLRSNPFVSPDIVVSSTQENELGYFFCKRVLDLFLVLIALPVLIPLVCIIAVLVKLDSPGPVIFRQIRVGTKRVLRSSGEQWEKQEFTILKFRTMFANSSSDIHQQFVSAYIAGDEAEMARIQNATSAGTKKYKLERDPRITRIGHLLRKTSLDELPQLWNVLKGDMSLVGPRPAIPYEVEMYEEWHEQRLQTIQGLTGYWQISGRNAINFDEMVRLDIEYINRQSIWLDLRILLFTLPTVLLRRGAE